MRFPTVSRVPRVPQGVDMHDPEVPMVRNADDSAPFSGLCFKIMTDPFVGSLTFCRIYSGGWGWGGCSCACCGRHVLLAGAVAG